jgi:hypothetical protein
MKKFIIFILIFLPVMFVAGAVAGFAMAFIEESGRLYWLAAGFVALAIMTWYLLRMVPKFVGDDAFMALMFGDMEDPKQRWAMFRIFLASLSHGVAISMLNFGSDEPATSYWPLVFFIISFIWLLVECWLFYMMDEYWRNLILGPMALAGVMVAFAAALWGAVELYVPLPSVSPLHVYFLYLILSSILVTIRMHQASKD